jgi:hypothetical protein
MSADIQPKQASVRHCLSLNKEFVRMQRAVEDPGVGCGGWWSVGEGMKGMLSRLSSALQPFSLLLRSETAAQKTTSTVKAP